MATSDYWSQYERLRRYAKQWNIDYARYTHSQLQYAIELNNGVVDASLRLRLSALPPVNAYHAAINSGKTEMHEPLRAKAIQKADPLPEQHVPVSRQSTKTSTDTLASFSIEAPKEASPWTSVSA